MTDREWGDARRMWAEARRISWEVAIGFWDWLPVVGEAEDGAPIRKHPSWGTGVKEPSGYVCSPVAYSVRLECGR